MGEITAATGAAETTVSQETLVTALLDPSVYSPPVDRVDKLETHISYVLLAGSYVYKIKKAVDLGFLDFRTLTARRFYCQEELRLNRRLAPWLYLDVVPISWNAGRPVFGTNGLPIEYAVKMHRFSQDNLLSALLAHGRLTTAHIDELADKVAAFHAQAAIATEQDAYGTPEAVAAPALENFAQIKAGAAPPPDLADLHTLEAWTVEQLHALAAAFRARKSGGYVRECHGDLHTGNVTLVDGQVTIFDCLEFSANLRWIDIMNEVAFMVMDLHDRKRPDLARRFLNRYLEITGDYEGLPLLRYYVAYRALVRAKVHWLRAHQPGVNAADTARLLAQYRGYIGLALAQTRPARPAIILTHGLSGSGKTTHTQSLVELIDAVRVRSDLERKRLQGLPALARTDSGIEQGAYSADATARTYERLLALAGTIVDAGYTAIVDATFLKRTPRDAFRRLAKMRGAPFVIIDFVADVATLRQRIRARHRRGDDASEADIRVLQRQIETQEPLQPNEQRAVVTYDATQPPPDADRAARWAAVLERLTVTTL